MTTVTYLFATPSGDVKAPESLLSSQVKTGNRSLHNAPSLRDYFDILAETILEKARNLIPLELPRSKTLHPPRLMRLSITSEKCGSLYHVARADLETGELKRVCLAVITAFEPFARKVLERDHQNLLHLWNSRQNKLVPRPLYICDKKIGHSNNSPTVTISVMEWLQDFYEWHFTCPGGCDSCRITVWKPGSGFCTFPRKETGFRLFEKIAEILSYYFDPVQLCQVGLWNHAAGDFVVRLPEEKRISAMLTTAREYRNIVRNPEFDKEGNLLLALLYLFLDLVLNIRVDRLNGTGRYYFADQEFIRPTVTGFFRGLMSVMAETACALPLEELAHLLSSLSRQELLELYGPLLDFHRGWERADALFMEQHLSDHCRQLASNLELLQGHASELLDSTSELAA